MDSFGQNVRYKFIVQIIEFLSILDSKKQNLTENTQNSSKTF